VLPGSHVCFQVNEVCANAEAVHASARATANDAMLRLREKGPAAIIAIPAFQGEELPPHEAISPPELMTSELSVFLLSDGRAGHLPVDSLNARSNSDPETLVDAHLIDRGLQQPKTAVSWSGANAGPQDA
jgi:hypothetical protein